MSANLLREYSVVDIQIGMQEDWQNTCQVQLLFRYIAMQHGDCKRRREWLDRILPCYDQFEFGNHPGILTSRAAADFDVVIFGGEDFHRLGKFMRANGPLLRDKVKLSLCLRSDPAQRARLLAAGFDDVMDIRRVGHEEFMARARAIWFRYRDARQRRLEEHWQDMALEQVCLASALTAKQRRIVFYLLNAPKRSATCHMLRNAACHGHEGISQETLKVKISAIRKFLRPGYQIISDEGLLYRLIGPNMPG